MRGRAFLCCNLLAGLLVDVSFAFAYQLYGKVPQLLEVVGCVAYFAPFEAKPAYVVLDGLYVFRIFLLGIRVIETQVAHAAILLRDAEVHANRFGVTDVQVTVGFGRETRLQTAVVKTCSQVAFHNLLNEVQTLLARGAYFVLGFRHGVKCNFVAIIIRSKCVLVGLIGHL